MYCKLYVSMCENLFSSICVGILGPHAHKQKNWTNCHKLGLWVDRSIKANFNIRIWMQGYNRIRGRFKLNLSLFREVENRTGLGCSELTHVFMWPQSLWYSRGAEAADWCGSFDGHRGTARRCSQPRLQEHRGWPQQIWWLRLVLLPLTPQRGTQPVGQPPLQLLQVLLVWL